jgi:pilus assembly protein CpaB
MVMSPIRVGILLSVALAVALCLALVAHSLASPHAKAGPALIAQAPPKPTVRVLVAGRDLQPGDKLAVADFVWQPWPADNVNPAFIVDGPALSGASTKAPASVKIETAALNAAAQKARDILVSSDGGPAARLVEAIVREPMLKGEPILEAKVVRAGASGVMAVELDPGMRAMAVPLSAGSAAGGFILPGDHVDVVQSRQVDSPNGSKRYATGTVLENVKVLAIDQSARAQKSEAVIGTTATVEVSPQQAEVLAMAKAQGELTLTLRSYADIGGRTYAAGRVSGAPAVVRVFRSGVQTDVAVTR